MLWSAPESMLEAARFQDLHFGVGGGVFSVTFWRHLGGLRNSVRQKDVKVSESGQKTDVKSIQHVETIVDVWWQVEPTLFPRCQNYSCR